ncbi:hypothetical protein X777_03278 [Ooceraea biroi]|uniref:Ig-like domain-containing protein n=1 Tax=Ooceraea biroi TaxID=2015173 RepID=A0A026WKR4_OOCBI|nr:hypothetical protein X777_03278 [Ooceraea biroi]
MNRIDDLLHNRNILNNNVARVRQSPRRKEKRAKDPGSEVALPNENYENDEDADEGNDLLDAARLQGFPIWQVPESTVATINLNSLISPMTTQIEMVNPSLFTFERPLQLENLYSDRSWNEARMPFYQNSQETFGITVSDKNLILPKISNPKFITDPDAKTQSPKNHLMSSERKFMLIPISKDLYVLKNVEDTIRTDADKIIPKQVYKLPVGNKNNATSAIVSFKAHMHHDVEDVGRVYLQKNLYNHHLFDNNGNYLYSYPDSRVSEENRNPMESPASFYPNLFYPGITSPAHSNSIDTITEISIEQITPRIPDYETYSMDSAVKSDDRIESYNSTFLPTSSSFLKVPNYDIPLYSEENANYPPNISPAIKLDEINSFESNSKSCENFLTYKELGVEVTTIDFRNTFGIFDDLDTLVTSENVKMYSTNVHEGVFDLTQSTEDESKLLIGNENKDRTDFVDKMSTRYGSTLDASPKEDNTSFLDVINFSNAKNILNNYDNLVQDNQAPRTSILSEYSDKKSSNNVNHYNRFMDKILFNDYATKIDSFLKTEDTISTSFLPDTDEWTLKKEQSNTENPRTLLMAIKPLSAELQKLLNAVKLFNQSISDVQNKLCDKKNVTSARVERENKKKKTNITNPTSNLDYYKSDLSAGSFDKQFWKSKRRNSISKDRNIVDRTSHNIKFKRETKDYVRFLNKVTAPLRKYASSDNKLKIQNDRRSSFKNIKLGKRKLFKSDNAEKYKSSHSRFNRNLKSLTKSYGKQVKPIRRFIKFRLKKAYSTTPIIILSHLIGYNMSNKNDFLNKRAQNFQRNKLISSSHDVSSKAMSTEMYTTEKGITFSSVYIQFYKEATAYRDILTLLNMTKESRVEHLTDTMWTAENVTEPLLLMFTTTEVLQITTFLPYFIQELTTIAPSTTIRKTKPLEATESGLYEYVTETDFEYDKYGEDYEETNYTGMYEDYEYEDHENVTFWYDYTTEKITRITEIEQVNATIFKDFISEFISETARSVEITEKKTDYAVEIETSTEALIQYTTIEYVFTTGSLITTTIFDIIGTQLPVTLSAFTITMPTTLPLFYTTEITTLLIDKMTLLIDEATEESVTISRMVSPTTIIETVTARPTEKLTSESVILLTAFLEGITDITVNITIPAAVKTSIKETPPLITKMITEKEIIESTYGITIITVLTTQLATIKQTTETSITLATISEVTITNYTITSSPTISTSMESTISSIFTEIPITTSKLEEESPITQIEETLTAQITEAPTMEIPITSKIPVYTKATISTTKELPEISTIPETTTIIKAPTVTKISTATKISTMKITTTWITTEKITIVKETTPTIIKFLTTTKIPITTETLTPIEIATTPEILKTTTITEILTTIKIPTTTEILTTTEIITTEIPTTSPATETAITETTTIAETITTIKIPTTTEILTTEIATTQIVTTSPAETAITETTTIAETITTIKIPTTTEILTTEIPTTSPATETAMTEATTIAKIITTIKIPTTTKILTTEIATTQIVTTSPAVTAITETTIIAETITTIKIPITTKILMTTEIATTEITTETPTITETLIITTIPTTIETLTPMEMKITSTEVPTFTETATVAKTLKTIKIPTTTEIVTPSKITTRAKFPIITETTIAKTLTTIKIPITETLTPTEIAKTIEIPIATEITTIIEVLTTTKIPTTAETLTLTKIATVTKIPMITESTIITEILTTIEIPITTETLTSIEFATTIKPSTITETTKIIKTVTTAKIPITKITKPIETSIENVTTAESTTITETLITTESPIIAKTSIPIEIAITTEIPTTIEITTKIPIIETSLTTTIATLSSIERSEYITIPETTTMLTSFTESVLPVLTTTEIPVSTSEITPILSKTVSEIEEFMTTKSLLVISTTGISTTLFTETTVHLAISTSAAIEAMPEVETEYYVAPEPLYKEYEEYEEYDTEIPTNMWYDYEEYKIETKETSTVTLSTEKHMKLPEEKTTLFDKGTSLYETKISEFTTYSTTPEVTSIYTESSLATTNLKTPYLYTEKETSTVFLETTASTVVENITMIEVESESTTSSVSEKEESITTRKSLTFGSTEEYSLPSSTVFKILTEPLPLEYPTISSRYIDRHTKFTLALTKHITLPKFITKPKEVPEIKLEKTTTMEGLLIKVTEIEKLTSFFVSPMRTTLSEEEAIKIATTTTEFPEMETAIKTGFETIAWTTITMPTTEEEVVPHVTPLITPKAEIKFELTTSKTVGREEERKQLLQRLDDLKQHEKEVAEREEKLREKERQWHREKEERKRIMQYERERTENVTVIASTTASYVTTATTSTLTTAFIETNITTESSSLSTTLEIKITSPILDTFITTLNFSLDEIITISTEITPLYTIEEIMSVTIEKVEKIEFYTTAEATAMEYTTERTEKMYTTSPIIHTPRITTSIVDLYNISIPSVEAVTSYTIEEMYTTSYGVVYSSEPSLTLPTMISAGPISLAIDEFISVPITTFSMYEISVTPMATLTYTTEEIYTISYPKTYSKSSIISPIFTSPITLTTDEFITLSTFSKRFDEVGIISVTTPTTLEEIYVTAYSESSSTSATTLTTLVVSTIVEIEYKEIESLEEELRKKERKLEEREKLLLERERQLEEDIAEFERYRKEFEKEEIYTSTTSIEESTASINLTTPIPPTEKTTTKSHLTTTQIKKATEKKKYQTTTKIMTSWFKTAKHVPEEITQEKEVEIVTKRICLNVLENITIPLDKSRRNIVTKKVCLLYFPEKNEENIVGRLSRKLFAFQNRKIRRSNLNFPLRFRYNRRQRMVEATRKISNLQLSHHEWMSNQSTKPLQQFKGFTRIYEKMREPSSRTLITTTTDAQENITNNFDNKNLYERRVLDYYENFISPTTKSMLENGKCRNKNVFFRCNLSLEKGNNWWRNDTINVEKREAFSMKKNTRSWSMEDKASISNQKEETATSEENIGEVDNRSYTVNVLHLGYNKDKETHELISVKPDKDELIMIISESHDDNYATEENDKIRKNYYEFEEKDDVKEQDDDSSDEIEKEIEEENDYVEDMVENYMNYEEHTPSTLAYNKNLLDYINRRTTESSMGLLDQMWPTEKSTTYHLGGTRFWELDFEVTEPLDTLTTIAESKTINAAIIKTTCFHVVFENKRNGTIETKRYIHHKRNIHDNQMKKSNNRQDTSLKNITGKNMLLFTALSTKQPSIRAKKLKNNSQNLCESKRYKQNFNRKQKVKFNAKFPHNKDPIIVKNRNVINSIRSILDRTSFSLEEIKTLNCSRYKEIQDNVVISMDSDIEEAKTFPQPHYNTDSLRGQKYIKLEELEDDFKNDLELDNDHDVISLPGLNLNLPCNQDGDGITWLSSISRPSYSWKRTDGIALFGFVAENGDLELQNVNAKDTGNYTCIMTYIGPDNEEPVETTYKVHLQVVTLPRYILHGEKRYHARSCDERELDIIVTYLPLKLNSFLCEMDICNTYIITPSCSRSQITVNVLIVPSHIVKLMTIDPKHCNVFCLKAIQDKLSLILSRNLRVFFRKTIIFRLPHYEQRLVPNSERLSFARWKRGRTGANVFGEGSSNVGLFSGCPAGYGLRGTHCVPCNVGTYSEDGISHCKICPPGTYQPNHGARVCRTCTSPLTKGCYNMAPITVTLASLSVMISIFLLLLCTICCIKKKLGMKQVASIISKEGMFQQEKHIEEKPLIKDASENDDQQWDSEYRVKKKKRKFCTRR